MKKLYIITLLLFLFFAQSCNQKRTCPCFPEKALAWLPYENKSQIKFTNLQDTVSFIIKGFYKSKEYEIDEKHTSTCMSEASFLTEVNNKLNTEIYAYAYSYVIEGQNKVDYTYEFTQPKILSDQFYFSNKDEKITSSKNLFEYNYLDSLIVQNIKYKDVISLQKIKCDSFCCNICKLFIAKNHGIIKFEEVDETEWLLINE